MQLTASLTELPTNKTTKLARSHGALGGLTVETVTDSMRSRYRLPRRITGVVAVAVEPKSAAASAGLQQGDVILEINRRPVRNTLQFSGPTEVQATDYYCSYIARGPRCISCCVNDQAISET